MGSEARARLGLWFLLTVTLFSFTQLFDTDEFLGPAILGMLIATGIAVGVRRLGLGTGVSLIASAVALAWYLSLIFQGTHTLWSLPTPDSLQALYRSVDRALEHSQVDYAPVLLRPGYAAIVVAALWIATTIGEIATFRWRRPLTTSLLPIVAFAVAITTGREEAAGLFVALFMTALLTYWGLESSHRMRSWGRWVSAWAHQKDSEPESITGELARRLGAGAVLIAVVSPLFLPAIEDGLLSWRSGVGPGAGSGSGSGRLNPWVSLVPDIPNQTEDVFFTVEAEDAAYWRIVSLEVFDGVGWGEENKGRTTADEGAIIGPAVPISASEQLVQTVTVEGLRGDYLPAALAPVNVVRLGADGPAAWAGVGYDPDSGAVLIDQELDEGQTYQILSSTPAVSYEDLRVATPGLVEDLEETFFEMPEDITSQAEEVIAGWIQDSQADTPFEELVAIQNGLRAFEYNLQPPQPVGDRYVSDLLTRTRAGFCQQFATAFAAIARDRGYPSRVSVGFLPGEFDKLRGTYTVRGTDAHAWPEVYFQSYGWIAFEPTPRAESFRPGYTQPPAFGEGSGEGGPGEGSAPDPDSVLGGRGGAAFDDAAGGVASPFPVIDPRLRDPALPGQAGSRGTPEWQRTFTRLVAFAAVVLLLFLLSVPGVKEWRIRRRYAEAKSPDALAAAAFVQFEDEAAELAEARWPWESALSYSTRLATQRNVTERSAVRLARIYEAAAYAADDISMDQAQEAKRLARALRGQLWHAASWWSRLARLFSPRRLRTGF